MMQRIHIDINTAFYIRHVFSYQLKNTENGDIIIQYTNTVSVWFNNFQEAQYWLNKQEAKRVELDGFTIQKPSTKWEFKGFCKLDVKVVIDHQPLVSTGPLPDWLRNLTHRRAMLVLDTLNNDLCLWRCIVVHQGVRPDRPTAAARQLVQSFFNTPTLNARKTSLDEIGKVEHDLNKGKTFENWIAI